MNWMERFRNGYQILRNLPGIEQVARGAGLNGIDDQLNAFRENAEHRFDLGQTVLWAQGTRSLARVIQPSMQSFFASPGMAWAGAILTSGSIVRGTLVATSRQDRH